MTAPSASVVAPGEDSARLRNRLRGVRLLIVDDHHDAREILRTVFEHCGARVFVADSGREAFPLVDRARPHLVITDIAMPRWSGYRLLREIRSLPIERGGHTPVIALTAYKELHHEARALAAGFDAWLTKPIDIRELVTLVERLMARGRDIEMP